MVERTRGRSGARAVLCALLLAVAGSVLVVGAPAAAAGPSEPRNVSVSPGASGTLDVSWDTPDPWVPFGSYKVQWKSGSQEYDAARQATLGSRLMYVRRYAALDFWRKYTIRGLANGVEYTVRVIAVGSDGDGPASAEMSATPGDSAAPVLRGAVVDGSELRLVYNEALDGASVPPAGAFTVTVEGVSASVTGVSVDGREVALSLAAAPTDGGVAVGYSAPPTGAIQDTAGVAAASFAERPVFHQISGNCDRTSVVRSRLYGKTGVSDCADVRVEDLVRVTGTLNLYLARLTGLQASDFRHLVNLSELNLSFNSIRALPAGVFDDLAKLRHLNLEDNNLEALPAGVFDNLTELDSLNLSWNDLVTLPEGVFDSLGKLTVLSLYINELRELPVGVFDNLGNLEKLFLSNSKLTELPAGVFSGLSKARVLTLDDNDLASLPGGMLSNTPNLKILTLSGNNLSSLPDGLFSGITELRDLWLEDNPGAPFVFTAELEARGSSGVEVKVAQGAPFDVNVALSASGGTLSSTQVTVAAGSVTSDAVTVTPDTAGQPVTVSVDSAVFGGGYTELYTNGIQTGLGSSLVVSSSQMSQQLRGVPKADKGDKKSGTGTKAVPDPDPESESEPAELVAGAVGVPLSHDGQGQFSFEVHLSEEPVTGFSYQTMQSHAFTVTAGSVVSASRLNRPSNKGWNITVQPAGNADVTVELPATTDCAATGAICTDDGRKLPGALAIAVPGPPLTASAVGAPESHDGEGEFSFELHFSEEFYLSYQVLKDDGAFTVTGGQITKATRLESGKNKKRVITVQPAGNAEVTIVLPATTNCDAQGAICTADGRKLSTRLELTVPGPEE